ncbi:MAG: hypothetical protein JW873_02455 [Candidatus Saganbacteria bacterium]|nr:hypothetical protein [Candidatus Saganbacteria bacterium]
MNANGFRAADIPKRVRALSRPNMPATVGVELLARLDNAARVATLEKLRPEKAVRFFANHNGSLALTDLFEMFIERRQTAWLAALVSHPDMDRSAVTILGRHSGTAHSAHAESRSFAAFFDEPRLPVAVAAHIASRIYETGEYESCNRTYLRDVFRLMKDQSKGRQIAESAFDRQAVDFLPEAEAR